MTHLIDALVVIYADSDKCRDILTWLESNDKLHFDFHGPFFLPTCHTIIEGYAYGNVNCSFEQDATALFRTLHEHFQANIKLSIQRPESQETHRICFGKLNRVQAVEQALSDMINTFRSRIAPHLTSDDVGDLAIDLANLQTTIEKLHTQAYAALSDTRR